MKLVTLFKKSIKMAPEYVPGRCNIGARGRTIRLATGLGVIALFVAVDVLAPGPVSAAFRLLLFVPFYVGLLAALEGTMSFCVLHASRGTYDLHEPAGMAFGRSETKTEVGSVEWKRLGRRKARLMHLEALLGALGVSRTTRPCLAGHSLAAAFSGTFELRIEKGRSWALCLEPAELATCL